MSLTRHAEGSVRELWSISLPLMLSSLSVLLMIFVDRLMIANYSTSALNAAVNATTLGWTFTYGWMVLSSISEVFVAQHNGANRPDKIGEPVWQMIWISLLSCLFFFPMACFGGEWVYGTAAETRVERDYFKWMMLFGPTFPLYAALCGFFVGRGKTKLITSLAIAANFVNVLLDYGLIFGIKGFIQPMGPTGAAIATSGSCFFQVFVLAAIFLKKEHRTAFGTGRYAFNPAGAWQCAKVGLPGAVFVALEIFGWAAYYHMMTFVSEKHITIAGICQSMLLLLYFYSEGVSKAATTIAGNLIGANRKDRLIEVFKSGIKLHLGFLAVMFFLFFCFSGSIPSYFLSQAPQEIKESIVSSLMICLFFMVFYMFFEGVRLLLTGLLTAAGDTNFLLLGGTLSVWLLLVAPIYYFVVQIGAEVEWATVICTLYGLAACIIYAARFFSGRWRQIQIVEA